MRLLPTSQYKKNLKRLPRKVITQLEIALTVFVLNEFDARLNNHKLKGEYSDRRSIDINSDLRLLYRKMEDVCLLLEIGTHSDLYNK